MESKQSLSVLFAVAMGLTLTACGGSSNSSPPSGDQSDDGGTPPDPSGDTGDDAGGDAGSGDGGSTDGSSLAACFNEALLEAGTTYSQTLRNSGSGDQPDELTLASMVNGAAVFAPTGETGTEVVSDSTAQTPEGDFSAEIRNYADADTGAGVVRNLGSITTSSVDTGMGVVDSTTTVVFDPPSLDRFDLAPGESFTDEFSAETTTESSGLPGFDPGDFPGLPGGSGTTVETTRTVTYEGRDTVTVPAGTFETCRLSVSDVSTVAGGVEFETMTTRWIGVGFGLVVREIDEEGQEQSETVLVSGSINGQAVSQ